MCPHFQNHIHRNPLEPHLNCEKKKKTCEGFKEKNNKHIIVIIMKRGKKRIIHFILNQELWERKKKRTSKGSTLEPHLGYEIKEK
jgi:hypothetical protein